jgi:FkbM family methyltransferase
MFGLGSFGFFDADACASRRFHIYEYTQQRHLGAIRNKNSHEYSGQVFYDIGANIGWYSIIAALCVGEQGQVVSFEPSPENFRLLKSNLRLNNISRVRASRAAISNYDGQGALYKSDPNRGDHQTDAPDPSRIAERIRVRSLGAVMRQERAPDMIKLDTRGSEAKILDGLLRSGPKETLTLLVEYWPHGLARAGSTAQQLVEILEEFCGRIFLIDHTSQELEETTTSRLLAMAQNELNPKSMWFRDLLVLGPAAEPPSSLIVR